MEYYCAYQERCYKEVEEKLYSFSVSQSEKEEVLEQILKEKNTFLDTIENLITKQIVRIRTTETSPKNSKLYFALLLETNDLIKSIMSLLELFKEFNLQNNKK